MHNKSPIIIQYNTDKRAQKTLQCTRDRRYVTLRWQGKKQVNYKGLDWKD